MPSENLFFSRSEVQGLQAPCLLYNTLYRKTIEQFKDSLHVVKTLFKKVYLKHTERFLFKMTEKTITEHLYFATSVRS